MNILKWLGILSFLAGLLLSGFHAIGLLLERHEGFYNTTLAALLGEGRLEWIDGLGFEMLESGLVFVFQAPIYAVLLVLGIVILSIHGLFAKG